MKTVSRFLDPGNDAPMVGVVFDGKELSLPLGANLATALMVAGVSSFRSMPVSGSPRAPFCMMGACFDCLVRVDGTNRQACMMTVTSGLQITRPIAITRGHSDAN